MRNVSRLPPSKASRRVVCPGSRRLEERFSDINESPYSREGTAAHWIAHTVLSCGMFPPDHSGMTAPNGESITEDMISGAEIYLTSVKSVTSQPGCPALHIEETLDISVVHPDCWGTPDAWVVHNNELHLWDYKFGHRVVEVFENWQLIEYAAGIYEKQKFSKVTFYIVQPRSYGSAGFVRQWSISRSVLENYIEVLIERELLASKDKVECVVSPQCHTCSARRVCETLQQVALSTIDISKMNSPAELNAFQTGQELTYLRRAAAILDARITGLEEQAKFMIQRGERVQGFKMESVSSREAWTCDVNEIITLGDLLGVNLAKPAVLVTPNQARKLGIPEAVITTYATRLKGAVKLIEEDVQDARRIFSE